MKALAVCPTYGRLPFLGRFLASFISQTYDDKHLIIINDDKNIEICCDRDDVTILNCPRRLKIAQKRNLGAIYGTYDIIMPWDDDDIYLPNRIANHVKKFEDPKVKAYRNMTSYLVYGSTFTTSQGSFCSLSYKREEWFRVGGYAWEGGSGEDQEFYYKLENFLTDETPEQRDYVYNFGGINYHLSCEPTEESLETLAYKQLEEMNIVGKKFHIQPDFEEFNKFCKLDELYKKNQEDLQLKHIGLGTIDILHLL